MNKDALFDMIVFVVIAFVIVMAGLGLAAILSIFWEHHKERNGNGDL